MCKNCKGKYYITTPIYYPSAKLHIGHSYCTVATDAMARYKRLRGYDVLFLTGTDEHGQKIEDKAKEAGVTPQQYVDNIVLGEGGVLDLWKLMNISYDRFIRTTDDYHVAAIQKIFKRMYENGDIYKGKYVGKYCKPCESFWTESQLKDGKCPDCGRDVQDAEEEAYFFRLSKYADRLQDLLENTDYLEPRSRVNEMVNNFIKPGLEDLCVSRTSFTWGVPVDFDPGHVVYVWIDALFNYMTALGFENDKYNDLEAFWPADVHFVGKEIVRFHSIIWPAMLMSLDLPLPKKVYGHGWLNFNGEKMSKSRGNVVDPYLLSQRFGVDALRFFLLRTFPFGSDGNFTNELLISIINVDLANDLGNLVSRTTAMSQKYFGGALGKGGEAAELDESLKVLAAEVIENYAKQMDAFQFSNALNEAFRLIGRANKYIDETTPWILAKSEQTMPRLLTVMKNLCECIRIAAILITPIMPDTAKAIFDLLGVAETARGWDALCYCADADACWNTITGAPLFPRIDVEKELAALEELSKPAPVVEEDPLPEKLPEIAFDDFCKVEMTVVKVLTCEKVKKSEKLLKFTLNDGTGEPRQILSGIAKYYEPEQLIGKTLVAVTNLAPRKMMGQLSCGMLLSAERGDKLHLVMLDDAVPAGARLV
ncbi:MAG: methionine--tRNA ligase [Oscillospiraceae bacterium]|nr:methionine--tRNA ligase [Oscillospiraceae bacterium]